MMFILVVVLALGLSIAALALLVRFHRDDDLSKDMRIW
jgi:hypothetical protein